MAETLLRTKKETSVCVFEKEARFGGRILDHWFSQAPDVAVGKTFSSSEPMIHLVNTKDRDLCQFTAVKRRNLRHIRLPLS